MTGFFDLVAVYFIHEKRGLLAHSTKVVDLNDWSMNGSRIQSVPDAPLSCPRPVASASVALFGVGSDSAGCI